MTRTETLMEYAKRRAAETRSTYLVSYFDGRPMRSVMDCPHNRAFLRNIDETWESVRPGIA